jgi:hypothetical protein
MSQERVELTREGIDVFTRRDLGAYLALTDPKVELTPYEVAAKRQLDSAPRARSGRGACTAAWGVAGAPGRSAAMKGD